jgi:elongation factor P
LPLFSPPGTAGAIKHGVDVVKSTDLRPGMAIKLDGNLFVITQYQHVTPGNLRAFVQVKIKNLISGATIEKRLRSGEDVEQIDLDRRQMEFLFSESTGHVFMDSETFDQITLPSELIGDAMGYVKPNTTIEVLMAEGRPVSIDLPSTVDLEVKDTPPGIKGATATNQLKEATLETGLKTRVPPFINIGDVVRINTVDGSYNSRA